MPLGNCVPCRMPAFVQQLFTTLRAGNQRDALVVGDERWSFEQLCGAIGSIQAQLEAHAAEQGRIAVVNRQDAWTYAALLACWFSGKAFVPIEPSLPGLRIAEILAQAGLSHALDAAAGSDIETLAGLRCIHPASLDASEPQLVEISATAEAYILFTSGSTGTPKGVPISFGNA